MLHTSSIAPIASVRRTSPLDRINGAVDLAEAIAFLRRRRLELFSGIFAALSVAGLYLWTAPNYYTASTRVLIDARRGAPLDRGSQNVVFDDANTESQAEIVTSSAILLPVINNLRLAENPNFTNPPSDLISQALGQVRASVRALIAPPQQQGRDGRVADDEALAILVSNLNVRRTGSTFVLNISYRAVHPSLAADIVNAVADSFIKEEVRAKVDAAAKAGVWMAERIEDLREQANSAARAVQRFKTEHNLVDTGRGLVGEQQVSEVSSQLVLSRTRSNEAKARVDRINEVLQNGSLDATVTDALLNDVISKLRQLLLEAMMKEADISLRFGKQHQVAVRARDEVTQLRSSLRTELFRIAESFKSDYEIAKSRELSLEKSLAELVTAQAHTNASRAQVRELESSAQTYSALFESALRRHTELGQQQSFPIPEARIITRGTAPLTKSDPRTAFVVATAMLAGGMLGIGVGLLRETLDSVFRTPEALEKLTGLKCIAVVPYVAAANLKRRRVNRKAAASLLENPIPGPSSYVLDAPHSAFAEGIRAIKVAMDLTCHADGPIIVALTSAVPHEGKTTISGNLATVIVRSGRSCMLIDGDMRNPSLTRMAAPDASTGLADILTEKANLADGARLSCDNKFMFIPSCRAKVNLDTSSLLRSERMRRLLAEDAKSFDYVIIDLPPMAPLVDVRAISPFVHKVVVVVEWGHTKRDTLEQSLLRNGPDREDRILGLILNKIPPRTLQKFPTYRWDTYLRDA